MCGITGFINLNNKIARKTILKKMTDSLYHRGPDGEGHFLFENFAIGHRRLSIIDLSESSSQPMVTEDKNWIISYNGEIYNFKNIKKELQKRGYNFFSSGDTEVVLKSFIEWGKDCFTKFNGMFSFCIFNKKDRILTLARDRFGIKPLYYLEKKNNFLFSSEIKSFKFHPKVNLKMDQESLAEYLTFQNFIDDETLFKNVKVLKPGYFMEVDTDGIKKIEKFYNFNFEQNTKNKSYSETKTELKHILTKSVNRQLISDVPISCLLSGGIDSSAITAIASKKIKNLKTFTIGFNMQSISGIEIFFDEREKAEKVSAELGTEHYSLVLKSGDMEKAFDDLVWHLEEPRVGQSYPNFYASKLASKFNKVILTGIGGDELFAGYPWRYYKNKELIKIEDFYYTYFNSWNRLLDHVDLQNILGRKLDQYKFYDKFKKILDIKIENPSFTDLINYSLKFEIKTFLHGLLIVEDKLSMAHSLETRVPFLDNELSDYASKIPLEMKLKNIKNKPQLDENIFENKVDYFYNNYSDGKLILRDALKEILSAEILAARKQGFSGPDKTWFKGKSIDFVKDNLFDKNQKLFDFLDHAIVKEKVLQHISGQKNNRLLIWSFIYLNFFIKKFLN